MHAILMPMFRTLRFAGIVIAGALLVLVVPPWLVTLDTVPRLVGVAILGGFAMTVSGLVVERVRGRGAGVVDRATEWIALRLASVPAAQRDRAMQEEFRGQAELNQARFEQALAERDVAIEALKAQVRTLGLDLSLLAESQRQVGQGATGASPSVSAAGWMAEGRALLQLLRWTARRSSGSEYALALRHPEWEPERFDSRWRSSVAAIQFHSLSPSLLMIDMEMPKFDLPSDLPALWSQRDALAASWEVFRRAMIEGRRRATQAGGALEAEYRYVVDFAGGVLGILSAGEPDTQDQTYRRQIRSFTLRANLSPPMDLVEDLLAFLRKYKLSDDAAKNLMFRVLSPYGTQGTPLSARKKTEE